MASVNKVFLLGNLGADPDVREMQGNHLICTLRVATSRRYKDRDGQKQEETEWHRVVVFGRTAEIARDYLAKGSSVWIEGRLRTRKWQDKDGTDRYTTEIVCENLQLGSRRDSQSGDSSAGGASDSFESQPRQRPAQAAAAKRAPQSRTDTLDEEVPF